MNKKGFTLIELLAVIFLIGIITAASFPSIKKLVKENKQTKEEKFAAVLESAAKNYVLKNKVKVKDGAYIVYYGDLVADKPSLIQDSGDIDCSNDSCFSIIIFNDKGKITDYATKVNDYNTNDKSISLNKADNKVTIGGSNISIKSFDSLSYEKKPNVPVYDRKVMIPVVYTYDNNKNNDCATTDNGYCSRNVRVANTSNSGKYAWYDYNEGKWANVVTCKSEYRNACLSLKEGDIIYSNYINSYWVWIPRYEYKADLNFGNGSEKMIDVNFISKYISTSSSGYKIPDAFTFNNGESNLSGIWVAKFEASKSRVEGGAYDSDEVASIVVNYNEEPWTNIDLGSAFVKTREMELKGNPYGFEQKCTATKINSDGYINVKSDTNTDSNKLDTHLMQNSEWGAVAYLSQSKYSKRCDFNKKTCIEIGSNNYYSDSKFYTGYRSDMYKAYFNCYREALSMKEMLTINNLASTSNTEYGVYDMSGGAFDMVMGWKEKSYNDATIFQKSELTGVPDLTAIYNKNSKYTCGDTSCTIFSNKDLSHAMSETRKWYGNYDSFSNDEYPLIMRGGSSAESGTEGLFSYYGTKNIANSSKGFRPVLVMW